MKISVWDTYVKRNDGKTMHFDILVPSNVTDQEIIFNYGKKYLKSKPYQTGTLSSKECQYCHMEQATDEMISAINENGYSIIEMENCN